MTHTRFAVVFVLALILGVVLGAAVKNFDVTGSIHAQQFVMGDEGLSTSLGGVDTNYVNLNNPTGGIRWQFAQILFDTNDPSVTGRDAPTPSLLLRHVENAAGELWFKVGPLPTDWRHVALQP